MISGLPKSAGDISESIRNFHFYTSYKKMNELFNEFAGAANSDGIWFTADIHEFTEELQKTDTCDIIRMALDTARVNCIETTAPKNRFIKVRCRNMQNKNFIKIQYSCESKAPRLFDKNIVRIREAIEQAGGYLNMEVLNDNGVIKIALPSKG